MEDIKISVIIPVYNVENYLRQCVESVINQTYKNIEVFLIDDGSSDKSPAICDEYALNDNRIKVIHKKNEGVSAARNDGLKEITGNYVTYVDSDDWLDLNAFSEIVSVIEEHPGIGCLSFTYIKEYDTNSFERHIFNGDHIFIDEKVFYNAFYRKIFGLLNSELSGPEKLENLSTCWGKLYRSDLAKNGTFTDLKKIGSCEDGLYNIFALKKCKSAVYIDKCLYHYRYVKGSITTKYRPELVKQWKNLFSIMQNEIDNQNQPNDFQESLNNRISLSILGIGLNALSNNAASFSENRRYIKKYICSEIYRNAIHTTKIRKLPISWGVLLFCSKHRMAFFTTLILYIIKYIKTKL